MGINLGFDVSVRTPFDGNMKTLDNLTALQEQVSGDQHPDSKLQHLLHMFEGYRSHRRDLYQHCPYPPGSAREISWMQGWALSTKDDAE
jgi:hypothetical protein